MLGTYVDVLDVYSNVGARQTCSTLQYIHTWANADAAPFYNSVQGEKLYSSQAVSIDAHA
jgi:hypothetical protein